MNPHLLQRLKRHVQEINTCPSGNSFKFDKLPFLKKKIAKWLFWFDAPGASSITSSLTYLTETIHALIKFDSSANPVKIQMHFHFWHVFLSWKAFDLFHLQSAGSRSSWGPFCVHPCLFDYEKCLFDCLFGEQHLLYWLSAWQTPTTHPLT